MCQRFAGQVSWTGFSVITRSSWASLLGPGFGAEFRNRFRRAPMPFGDHPLDPCRTGFPTAEYGWNNGFAARINLSE
jgi:hypothetical protein